MSYDTKMQSLESILQDHNKAVFTASGKEAFQQIDVQEVKNKLILMGATSEETLSQCSFEDLESCGIPKLLAKQIAQVFRQGGNPTEKENKGFVSSRSAERMSYEELLARYQPDEENSVSKKLKELGKGLRFIVFNEDNTVDVATSVKLLSEIKQGFGERSIGIAVAGTMKPIYGVGDKPNNLVDENPLFHGRALRPDGTCDQLNRSWVGVPLAFRQLIYLAVKSGELSASSSSGHDTLDLALEATTATGERKLKERFPKAVLKFHEDTKLGTLPRLQIELGKQTNRVGSNQGKVTIIK